MSSHNYSNQKPAADNTTPKKGGLWAWLIRLLFGSLVVAQRVTAEQDIQHKTTAAKAIWFRFLASASLLGIGFLLLADWAGISVVSSVAQAFSEPAKITPVYASTGRHEEEFSTDKGSTLVIVIDDGCIVSADFKIERGEGLAEYLLSTIPPPTVSGSTPQTQDNLIQFCSNGVHLYQHEESYGRDVQREVNDLVRQFRRVCPKRFQNRGDSVEVNLNLDKNLSVYVIVDKHTKEAGNWTIVKKVSANNFEWSRGYKQSWYELVVEFRDNEYRTRLSYRNSVGGIVIANTGFTKHYGLPSEVESVGGESPLPQNPEYLIATGITQFDEFRLSDWQGYINQAAQSVPDLPEDEQINE